MRFNTTLPTLVLLLAALVFVGCDSDGSDDPGPDPGNGLIDVPATYNFTSTFEGQESESSVDIGGMVVRQLLLQDLKSTIDALAKPGATPIAVAELNEIYDYDDDGRAILSGVPDGLTRGATTYEEISTGKNLRGRKGADATLLYSAGLVGAADVTVNDVMQAYFQIIADNSNDPAKLGTPAVYTTDDGVDLTQMINKILIGAILFDQLSNKYLADILDRDNTEPRDEGKPDTEQEHRFDEAYGYFGAARNYRTYTDDMLAGGVTDFAQDSNGDGVLDYTTEYNFGIARNAGKRDKGGVGVNFTEEIFEAFLRGRTAVVNGNLTELAAAREDASQGFEKVIAATAVHYINDTLTEMEGLTQAEVDGKNDVSLNKFWGEMKGFTYALQFSYRGDGGFTGGALNIISLSDLQQIHALMGNAPVYALPGSAEYDAYVADLNQAKDIFQAAYGFSQTNMDQW
ncbi:MAG: DUF4856 domain-containing protein [Bacteroidota bacterium]